jgi:small subunit ribosomal protein S1
MDSSEETIEQDTTPENKAGEENSHPMDALLEDNDYGIESPRRGEIRTGPIARITDTDVLVDIGYKSEGIIPTNELEKLSAEKREALTIGSEVVVYVLRTGNTVLLSLSRAEEEKDWIDAQDLLKSKEVYEGVVSGYNKGGLIVKLGGIRGFIPASQVSIARRWRAEGDSPDQRWGSMVGEAIAVKVIEVERRRNRLILSERAAAREAREMMKRRLISTLEPGEERTGHVISLADFGAFVDIGGADGLVHTSEISWKRISHPREVLKVGQEVQVRVLAIDAEQNRISLSIRELLPDPWDSIVDHFKEGQLVEGVITKLTKFGAFASLRSESDFEVEGLVHISELSDRHIVHPREVVSENETLTLRIIRVDKERRRIGLSLKRVDSPEYAEMDWQAAMKELDTGDEEEGTLEPGVDAEAEAEPEAEVQTAGEAEGESAVEPEAEIEPEAEVKEEAETDVEAEPEAEVQTAGEAEGESAVESEAELKAEAEAEAEPEAEVQTAGEAEGESAVEPEAEIEAETEPEAEVKEEVETDVEAEPEAEMQTAGEEESKGSLGQDEQAEPKEMAPEGISQESQEVASEIDDPSEIMEEAQAEDDQVALLDEPDAPDEGGDDESSGIE